MLTQKPPKTKKQATIFELQRVKSENTQTISIDLTCDEDVTAEDTDAAILCPVCSIKMSLWEMDVRITHVEECLSLLTIREAETRTSVSHADSNHQVLGEEETTPVKIEGSESFEAKDSARPTSGAGEWHARKKREAEEDAPKASRSTSKKSKNKVSTAQLEMQSFINSKPQISQTKRKQKIPEADTENGLLPSSRKNEIPKLKILSFAKDGTDSHLIAVDAFCYKPHDYICQYFLSHFHSDHYGGFTKRWCRERTIDKKILYCSEVTAKLLMIRYNAEPEFIFQLKINSRYKIWSYEKIFPLKKEPSDTDHELDGKEGYIFEGGFETTEKTPGLYVTSIDANHCPGATIFLFESVSIQGKSSFSLHCGDFRVCRTMLEHPALTPFYAEKGPELQSIYLDTTYMSPMYNFPLQETVCDAAATMIEKLAEKGELYSEWLGNTLQSRITDFLLLAPKAKKKKKFLVLVGTYLIGKEKLAIAILRKMGSCPIYVSNISSRGDKKDIVASFGNDYLDRVLTQDDTGRDSHGEVVVHLVPMKVVGTSSAISSYFNHNKYFEHFEKCIGFRPTGWAIQDTKSRFEPREKVDLPLTTLVKILKNRPTYTYMDILSQKRPQSDKTLDKPTFKIYSLPYSEHLSFRELSFFALWLNLREIIPTVNTENEQKRAEMRLIIQKWIIFRDARVSSMNGLALDIHGLDSLTLACL